MQPGCASRPAPEDTSSTSERGMQVVAWQQQRQTFQVTGGDSCHDLTYVQLVKSGALIGVLLCMCAVGPTMCKRRLTTLDCELAAEACYGEKVLLPSDEGGVCELTSHKAPAKRLTSCTDAERRSLFMTQFRSTTRHLTATPFVELRSLTCTVYYYLLTVCSNELTQEFLARSMNVWRVRQSRSKAGYVRTS